LSRLKVKGPDIYTSSAEQQRFTLQSGVLTRTSSRQRGAISGHPLPEQMDFEPAIAARQTHLCPSQLHRNVLQQWVTHYFSSEYYQILIATHLLFPEGWMAELA